MAKIKKAPMLAPLVQDEETMKFCAAVPARLVEEVQAAARRNGTTVSDVIRFALRGAVDRLSTGHAAADPRDPHPERDGVAR